MSFTASVKVPATSANLGPGFDCLGVALGLFNEITLKILDSGTGSNIRVKGSGEGIIPEDSGNLVYRVIRDFLKDKGVKCPSMELELKNNIPIERGLGSSAAAIAGGLLIADKLAGSKSRMDELIARAVKIEGHADNIVPAFAGGLCITRIEKDFIPWWREKAAEDLCACLCIPEFSVVTKTARKLMPMNFSRKTSVFTISGAAFFVAAITSDPSEKRDSMIRRAMEDKFHQPHRKKLVKGMDKVFRSALDSGALGVALSGSGPSIISILRRDNDADSVGRAMTGAFAGCGIKSEYKVLEFVQNGAEII